MSNIGDYQALVAAFAVTFTSQYARSISIKSTDAKKLENRVNAHATPIRLLLPFGGGENISAEMTDPAAPYAAKKICGCDDSDEPQDGVNLEFRTQPQQYKVLKT